MLAFLRVYVLLRWCRNCRFMTPSFVETPTMAPPEPALRAARAAAGLDADLIAAGQNPVPPGPTRTIWGFDPVGLHTRYWASHGVQVVRQGEPSEIVKHAELFLLTDPTTLTLF